MQTLIRTKL